MRTLDVDIAGLSTTIVAPASASRLAVVMLHGHAMKAADLAPFASSLGTPATFYFPQGAVAGATGYSWWPVDEQAKARALLHGPRDLATSDPPGRDAARAALRRFIDAVRDAGARNIVLGGFSQGGMLACDTLLMDSVVIDALFMLSASLIATDDWTPRRGRLHRLPVFVSHGRGDTDLDFQAGLRLQQWLQESGAETTWLPFGGGHQITLPVWRSLRRFLVDVLRKSETAVTACEHSVGHTASCAPFEHSTG